MIFSMEIRSGLRIKKLKMIGVRLKGKNSLTGHNIREKFDRFLMIEQKVVFQIYNGYLVLG
jgi:hypothetical protein